MAIPVQISDRSDRDNNRRRNSESFQVIMPTDVSGLREIFPRPDFEIIEITELGEPPFIAIRTQTELADMRAAGVKFKILEDGLCRQKASE